MTSLYATVAWAVFLYMNAWFAVSIILKRNDVADIAWGLGFVMVTWMGLLQSNTSSRAILITIMVTVWGIRLAWHIASRNWGKPEDARYAAWRRTWKHFIVRSYLQVFLLQGCLLYIIALPITAVHADTASALGILDVIGGVLWVMGFVLEAVADLQLKHFIRHPDHKGKLMTEGLWAYSRHPNYFGEILQWWGVFFMAVSSPGGILTIVSPLTITVLIRYVSGVPLLEKKYEGRPDFEEYKRKTSTLIPWFTKKETH